MERNWQTRQLKLHQGTYTRKLLEAEQITNCNPRRTPLEASVLGKINQLQKEKLQGPLGKEKEYNQFQGKLMWLLKTRPDLFFCVCLMSRFLRCAGTEQMTWTRQVLKYLASDPDKGIILTPGDKLYLWGSSDSDWGGDALTMKLTSAGGLSLGGQAWVIFYSRLQRKVADSSQMAETYAAHELVRSVIEVYNKLQEMGVNVPLPIVLQQDNEGVIKMSKNPIAHSGSKHFRIPQAFIRGAVEDGFITMVSVDSKENCADMGTKLSTPEKFERDAEKIMGAQGSFSVGACQRYSVAKH